MTQEVILVRGLPASGKSTYCKEWVGKDPTKRVRINKDDLRSLMHNSKFSKSNETQVKYIQGSILLDSLERGKSVIIDDTNLTDTHLNRFQKIIAGTGKPIQITVLDKFLEVSPEECIQRDKTRGEKAVGADVIWRMYWDHIAKIETQTISSSKKDAIIIDLDGTLFDMDGKRSPYDWSKVKNDKIRSHIRTLATVYNQAGYTIIIVTGRDGCCEEDSKEALAINDVPYNEFFIRQTKDSRKDCIIKREIYENKIAPFYNVHLVVDDRPQVIREWRRLGLPVINANPIDREF